MFNYGKLRVPWQQYELGNADSSQTPLKDSLIIANERIIKRYEDDPCSKNMMLKTHINT